jgi:hypothetical protein
MKWQSIISGILVCMALIYLIWIYRKKGSGSCGCDKCIKEKKVDPFS